MPILHAPVRILGCGNLLMGNDGVGIKVIEALKKTELGSLENLDIEDAGVCGLDLLNYFDEARKVIIVDAILANSPVGSIHRFDGKELLKTTDPLNLISVHDLTITDVIRIAEHIQDLPEIVVIGIEIGTIITEATLELSPEVLKGLEEAVKLIKEEVAAAL